MKPVIILLTYARTEYALRTITAAAKNLICAEGFQWYIADDGSNQEHIDAVLERCKSLELDVMGWHTIRESPSYGKSANMAWHAAHNVTDVTLFLEDDWELQQPLQLDNYIKCLTEQQDVGMIRMGYLNLNMRGVAVGYNGSLFWKLDRDCDSYVFTGHPSLRHRRFREDYGAYPEGLAPGMTELGYATQFRFAKGCNILYPAAFGEGNHIFAHIGKDKG